MVPRRETVVFLWRCSGCPAVYDAGGLASLLDDGTSKACFCGGLTPWVRRRATRLLCGL